MAEALQRGFTHKLFPIHLQLIPQMHELYEMELASAEAALMSDEELVRNAGYFARIGNQWTRHFLIASGEPLRLPKHSSSQLRSFFQSNQFRTGYATHGLFPYRGKFHPQMIKGLLNAMGLRPGDTVVDPMMGSGTVLIEAKLMGIKSIGLDASPFCRFMVQAKLEGLTLPLKPLHAARLESKAVFEHFKRRAGQPVPGSKVLFSPPYSFAIDYLENDSFHLNYLGVNLDSLRAGMVGLRGRTLREKFDFYRQDMAKVMAECARVLRSGRFCTVVVGTNNNQLSKILGTSPENVTGIDELIADWANCYGLHEVRKLNRQIKGMSNTMRTEHIVFLQKP